MSLELLHSGFNYTSEQLLTVLQEESVENAFLQGEDSMVSHCMIGEQQFALKRYLLGYPRVDENKSRLYFEITNSLSQHFQERKTIVKIPGTIVKLPISVNPISAMVYEQDWQTFVNFSPWINGVNLANLKETNHILFRLLQENGELDEIRKMMREHVDGFKKLSKVFNHLSQTKGISIVPANVMLCESGLVITDLGERIMQIEKID